VQNFTEKKWVLLCSANAWIGTHATFPVIPKWCCHFSVVQSFQFEFTTHLMYLQGKHSRSIDRKYNCCECWCYIVHIKWCFPRTNQWLLLHVLVVCKQSDKNHSVHGCPFLAVIFRRFFSVWWLNLEINHSLVAKIICTIYSFIHASTQHNISSENSFQQCFIFNWSAQPLACAPFGTKSLYLYWRLNMM